MKLKTLHVTNYRSIEDSESCTLDQVLCLVGKNEAGKTAVLLALAGLNPHPSAPITYDKERDYPRRFLTDYTDRHGGKEATVISTIWKLSNEEAAAIRHDLGPDALKSEEVRIWRTYGADAPSAEVSLNYGKIVSFLLDDTGVSAEERQVLQVSTTDELRQVLETLSPRTETQETLLTRLSAYPGKNARGFATDVALKALPKFLYFSHYDRMDGQIRLDDYETRRTQPNDTSSGERVFVDFLEYAGTSISEIIQAKTYETLNARCEAASNKITAQLLEYWTQNPHLEIEVRVTKAEPNDPPPFNQGVIARARVRNNLHKVTVPFSERSAGFIWFFSFLVKFAQVQKSGGALVLLLDEPGLTLHGKAQADLLRYFEEKLAPHHQVIFSTHSPFMVPANRLPEVRIVEDRVLAPRPGQWISEGTKIRSDALALDRDTLFPLQGALGYELTQTLFVGKHTLLVEGPSDILYLQSLSRALRARGRTELDSKWTLCPAGSIDKIQPFVSLFSGAKLDIAALTDYARRDARKFESLTQNNILSSDRLLNFAKLLGLEEADVEDIFDATVYLKMCNAAFELSGKTAISSAKLDSEGKTEVRLVKKMEACFRLLHAEAPNFNHYRPAEWLFLHPEALEGEDKATLATLDRAEIVIKALNTIPSL